MAESAVTILAPKNDLEWAELVMQTNGHEELFGETTSNDEADIFIVELGKRIGNSPDSLASIIELSGKGNNYNAVTLGRGLAQSNLDMYKVWEHIHAQLLRIIPTKRSIGLVGGILCELFDSNSSLAYKILYDVADDAILKSHWLMLAGNFFDRIPPDKFIGFMRTSDIDASSYVWLARNVLRIWSQEKIVIFFEVLFEKPNGIKAGVKILWEDACVFNKKRPLPPYLQEIGHQLLLRYNFDETTGFGDEASSIFKSCEALYTTDDSKYREMLICIYEHTEAGVFLSRASEIISELAKISPPLFLDVFLQNSDADTFWRVPHSLQNLEGFPFALSAVDDECLIDWCIAHPEKCETFAQVITPFRKNADELLEWTPIAMHLLENAEQPETILETLSDFFWPRSWSGSSRIPIVKPHAELLILQTQNSLTGLKFLEFETVIVCHVGFLQSFF